MRAIVLASTSAVRRRLLAAAGVPFEAIDPKVDESAAKQALADRSPGVVAQALADRKALAGGERRRDALVIGADQTLELDGRAFDKATSLGEARARLITLRGRSHRLHSAIAVADGRRLAWRHAASATMTMRDFSDTWLDAYLASNARPALASVGAYELEGEGAQLFSSIEGEYFTILGLPLLELLAFLREAGALPA